MEEINQNASFRLNGLNIKLSVVFLISLKELNMLFVEECKIYQNKERRNVGNQLKMPLKYVNSLEFSYLF